MTTCWMMPDMVHVWAKHQPGSLEATQRHTVAAATWSTQPWIECPVTDQDAGRLFSDRAGSVPYMKDLFARALNGNPSRIIVYTNSDICVRSDTWLWIVRVMRDAESGFCSRRDFYHDFKQPISDGEIEKGAAYSGTDLFVFRARWWLSVRDMFPDMLLGREAWDAVLREIVMRSGGVQMQNLCYHRKHDSVWERAANRWSLPSQLHCINLAKSWTRQYAVDTKDWGLR